MGLRHVTHTAQRAREVAPYILQTSITFELIEPARRQVFRYTVVIIIIIIFFLRASWQRLPRRNFTNEFFVPLARLSLYVIIYYYYYYYIIIIVYLMQGGQSEIYYYFFCQLVFATGELDNIILFFICTQLCVRYIYKS